MCIGEPGPAGDPERKVGAGGTAEAHGVGAPNLVEQRFGDPCQIRWGQRELGGQKRGIDEPEKESTSAAAECGLIQLGPERSLVASRLLLEREEDIRVPGGFEHRGGEGGERTLACPEMELGLGAGVARGGEEL